MRRTGALLLAVALAGCIGAGQPDERPAPEPTGARSTLRILTEDLEVRPLAGATVTLGEATSVSDEVGVATFADIVPGPQTITAWAPGFYHNRTTLDVIDPNGTYEVLLAERPEYLGIMNVSAMERSCNALRTGPLPGDRECRPMPPESDAHNEGVALIDQNVSRLEVWMTWTGDPDAFSLDIEFTREGQPLAMADGRSALTLEGPSPLWLDLGLSSFTSEMRAAPFSVRMTLLPPAADDGPQVISKEVLIETTAWYHLPPPDDPCKLHPTVCR